MERANTACRAGAVVRTAVQATCVAWHRRQQIRHLAGLVNTRRQGGVLVSIVQTSLACTAQLALPMPLVNPARLVSLVLVAPQSRRVPIAVRDMRVRRRAR